MYVWPRPIRPQISFIRLLIVYSDFRFYVMCTVSFIARRNGYALAMNRDEKLTRVAGLPPRLRQVGGRAVLCPSESGGGTWIALNDTGATLVLINWYSIKTRVTGHIVSRGVVVNSASGAQGKDAVDCALTKLPLAKINPFRLIGVFPNSGEIFEWRWELKRLRRVEYPWKPQQWISSGFDEPQAQRMRSNVFRLALAQRSVGSLEWLRRLHRSHAPEFGPLSTCMHRADAATVSYTEITVSSYHATMRYHSGAPCRASNRVVANFASVYDGRCLGQSKMSIWD
jgi:hypothetical protein